MIETSVGRVLFNEFVPEEIGFIDELLTKKALRILLEIYLINVEFPKRFNS